MVIIFKSPFNSCSKIFYFFITSELWGILIKFSLESLEKIDLLACFITWMCCILAKETTGLDVEVCVVGLGTSNLNTTLLHIHYANKYILLFSVFCTHCTFSLRFCLLSGVLKNDKRSMTFSVDMYQPINVDWFRVVTCQSAWLSTRQVWVH